MNKHSYRINVIFILAVFVILVITTVIISFIAAFLNRVGLLNFTGRNPLFPVVFLLAFSVGLGTIVSAIIGRAILGPITRLVEAMNIVANGDFSVRLAEDQRVREVQQMAKNFNAMAADLASIETLRNDFVTSVSHEFKTPIAAMEGYATLIQDPDITDEERSEYATIIVESARSLSELTGNILNLSRLEQQEIIKDKEYYRLDEQIRHVVLLLEPLWDEKQLDMIIQLDEVMFHGKPALVQQVWLNLLSNAIKFTPQQGRIEVILSKEALNLCVVVRDTGIGISTNEQKHIFDKFYQGDDARATSGNGLGLALAKRIVDLCDGSITVNCPDGQGSEFIVTLPV